MFCAGDIVIDTSIPNLALAVRQEVAALRVKKALLEGGGLNQLTPPLPPPGLALGTIS